MLINEIFRDNKPIEYEKQRRWFNIFAMMACAIVVTPFLIVTYKIGIAFILNPQLFIDYSAKLLKSFIFSFGFSIALICSVITLISKSEKYKVIGTAGTIFGFTQIIYVVLISLITNAKSIKNLTFLFLISFPFLLTIISFVLLFRHSSKYKKKKISF
ncbi:MAG: hypothetical protein SNJ70_06085 [Armatimonadota bacterium]